MKKLFYIFLAAFAIGAAVPPAIGDDYDSKPKQKEPKKGKKAKKDKKEKTEDVK